MQGMRRMIQRAAQHARREPRRSTRQARRDIPNSIALREAVDTRNDSCGSCHHQQRAPSFHKEGRSMAPLAFNRGLPWQKHAAQPPPKRRSIFAEKRAESQCPMFHVKHRARFCDRRLSGTIWAAPRLPPAARIYAVPHSHLSDRR